MLERYVEIGQHFAVRHQRNNVIDVGIGVDIVQPHPNTEFAESAGKINEFCPHILALPLGCGVFYVDAVCRRILRYDQKFLDPGFNQPLGLAQHVGGRPGDQIAAQSWDDAERATIVATL